MPTNAAKSSTGDALDRLEQLRLLGLGQLPEPEPETRPDDGFSRWAAELQAQAVELGDRLLADLQAHPFDDGDIDRLFAEMAIPDPAIEQLLAEADRSCDALMAELAEIEVPEFKPLNYPEFRVEPVVFRPIEIPVFYAEIPEFNPMM
jgi:hypothetical protein